MPRRKPYTKVYKKAQVRAEHVRRMSDVVFKGFQCLNSDCTEFIFIRRDEVINSDFEIRCPKCGFIHRQGKSTKFYEYELIDKRNNSVIERGDFQILHDNYISEAGEFKYCIICNCLKPLELFHKHSARISGRQGECILCKTIYNSIKNQTRLTEQHIEASQNRRLYIELTGHEKLDRKTIIERFGGRCFKCGEGSGKLKSDQVRFDHTLPAFYLWPMTNENATLLCDKHNSEKAEKWPSEYYNDDELRRLAIMTGYDYSLLKGQPQFNPAAIEKLKNPYVVDDLLERFSKYMPVIIKLRNRILKGTGFDFFKVSRTISSKWIQKANDELKNSS